MPLRRRVKCWARLPDRRSGPMMMAVGWPPPMDGRVQHPIRGCKPPALTGTETVLAINNTTPTPTQLELAANANIETGVLLLTKETLLTAIQDRELDRPHLRVLAAVMLCMNGATARAWPGRARLAEMLGVEVATISNRLRDLRKRGYLMAGRERVRAANNRSLTVYTFGKVDHDTIRAEIERFVARVARTPKVTGGSDVGGEKSPGAGAFNITEPGDFRTEVTAGSRRKSPGAVDSNSCNGTLPPYPPANGGNSAGLDQVNEADQPYVERLRDCGQHVEAIDGLIVPLLAKVRLSAADKSTELAAIAADADGLTDEELAKAVAIVLADGRERVKAARIREAVRAVRIAGACVMLMPGTPSWEAWDAYDRAHGVKFRWWDRAEPWQKPSRMPPHAPQPAEGVT